MQKLKFTPNVQYGKWYTVSDKGRNARYNSMWECRCLCGYQGIVRASLVLSDQASKCNGNHTAVHGLPDGESSFRALFNSYRQSAGTRGHLFDLDLDNFRDITQGDCFYCGIEPRQIHRVHNAKTTYTYNGIDRKDNTQGYILSNCVPCCWQCNKIKSVMPYDDFIAWINRLVACAQSKK
jgi:5-methylcytosine-specific restriction endonuclease McrA